MCVPGLGGEEVGDCLPAVSWACGFSSPRVISLLVGRRKQNMALGFLYDGAPGEQRVALCSPQREAQQVGLAACRLLRHSEGAVQYVHC